MNHGLVLSGGRVATGTLVTRSPSSPWLRTLPTTRLPRRPCEASPRKRSAVPRSNRKQTLKNTSQLALANVNYGINNAHSVAYNFMMLRDEPVRGEYNGGMPRKIKMSRSGVLPKAAGNDNLLITHQLLSDWTLSPNLGLCAESRTTV